MLVYVENNQTRLPTGSAKSLIHAVTQDYERSGADQYSARQPRCRSLIPQSKGVSGYLGGASRVRLFGSYPDGDESYRTIPEVRPHSHWILAKMESVVSVQVEGWVRVLEARIY
jgi:hypothetical protein